MNLFEFMHGKYGYLIILLINSRFRYVDRKSDALDNLIKFKVESDNLLGKHIKAFRLDRGGLSNRFDSFHIEHEIIS